MALQAEEVAQGVRREVVSTVSCKNTASALLSVGKWHLKMLLHCQGSNVEGAKMMGEILGS